MGLTAQERDELLLRQLAKRKEQRRRRGLPERRFQYGYTPEQGEARIAELTAMSDSEFPLRYETPNGCVPVYVSRDEAIADVLAEVAKTAQLKQEGLVE